MNYSNINNRYQALSEAKLVEFQKQASTLGMYLYNMCKFGDYSYPKPHGYGLGF